MNMWPWERNYKNSRSQMFFKKSVLKNFASFTGKGLCWSLLLIKLQIRRLENLLRRDSDTAAMRKKYRSSRSQILFKKGVLKNLWKHYREITVLASLFDKVAGLKTWNSIKNTVYTEHLWWSLLKPNICCSCRFITY